MSTSSFGSNAPEEGSETQIQEHVILGQKLASHGDDLLDSVHGTLLSHLLASKRSLSSASHVWRANELVTTARIILEESIILRSRVGFLTKGGEEQMIVLRTVRQGVGVIAREGQAEFKEVLRDLDAADARLQKTLKQLRSTIVEPSFRGEEENPKSLLEFVDEESVDGIMGLIRASIDRTNEAQRNLDSSNQAYDDDLEAVNIAMTKVTKDGFDLSSQSGFQSPISTLMNSLEIHAKEMADLLESLVRHFDLCVTAIKHTEGGGATAYALAGDVPEGVDMNMEDIDAPPEPMTDAEMRDMLEVLGNDAADVDDVAAEIRDHLVEMESQFDHITSHADTLARQYADAIAAFQIMEQMGENLMEYVTQSRRFLLQWDEEKQSIEKSMEELESLGEFYEGFLMAYDGLIVEVGRRKTAQIRMEKAVEEAMKKLQQLYQMEVQQRENFRRDQGDYLPSDIWPGLVDLPAQYEVLPVDNDIRNVP